MEDKRISELPLATTPLAGTEEQEIIQGGVNKRVAVSEVGGGGGVVETIVAGTNITVDSTDPANPIVSATGGGGGTVTSVSGTANRITSTGGATPVIDISATFEGLLGKIAQRIDQNNAATTSAQLAGVISDETGSGALVFATSPTLAGTPAAPTAATTTNTTQVATTAFVQQEIAAKTVGVQDLFIPASAMWPRLTGGCAPLQQLEMATSLFNIQALAFDQTTQEFAQFQITLPRKYNNGTVTVVPYWTAQSGSGTVQWGISGGAYRNDDALTVALGTPQTSDDTLLATNDLHIGPATSAITLAGTLADADFLAIQVSRNPASDTLSGDALLLGISVRITTDAAIDA